MSLPLVLPLALAALGAAAVLVTVATRVVPRVQNWWAGRAAGRPTGSAGLVGLERLRRQRRLVLAILGLPVVATIAGNVLHAQPTVIGRIIAGWAPLALLIAIEIVIRTPTSDSLPRRSSEWVGTGAVIVVAAWVSYWHLAAVCARYGESGVAAHIIPLSIDGLVMLLSGKLATLSRLIRAAEEVEAAAPSDELPAAVARLLPTAMEVARRIAPNGTPPSGRALRDALREANYGVASDIVSPLTAAVAARWDAP